MNKRLQVGDSVTVINNGQTYSSYKTMAQKLLDKVKWKQYEIPKNGSVGVIIAEDCQESGIYGIEIDNFQYLISGKGLETTSTPNVFPQTITKINEKILFPIENLILE
jgi:hypothetical protein